MIVSELMTESPIAATIDQTINEVLLLMHDADVRHIPIVDASGLVGIVSDRDLLRVGRGDSPLTAFDEPIATIMSGGLISVDTESELTEVVELMVDQRVGAIPVVDRETRQLVGIVSYIDVLRAGTF